jgi:hypothetical protein
MHVIVLGLSTAVLSLVFVLFLGTGIFAGNPNPGREANASKCDTTGNPIINVNEKVLNTVDSGQGGNYWAFDNINRHIQVWQNDNNTFCVLVQNSGKFDGQAGQNSPGNTGVLTGNEDGSFQGGYRARISGILKGTPGWETKGSVGTTDYDCDISGTCPGRINWVEQYFGPGYVFTYEWWGWTYKYKNNTWINSSEGNSGDII